MSDKQHTVLALYLLILVIRLWSSGRLLKSWDALTHSAPSQPTNGGTAQKGVDTSTPLPNPSAPV